MMFARAFAAWYLGLMRKPLDISGQRYGLLVALARAAPIRGGSAWSCKCDCGKATTVPLNALRSGNTTSCGCKRWRVVDLTGLRYGRLTVVTLDGVGDHGAVWVAHCDCGKRTTQRGDGLRSGRVVSCGCYVRENTSRLLRARNLTHGLRRAPEYIVWHSMLRRCLKPRTGAEARNYKDRGITVCKRWLRLENFLADMGQRPSAKHTLERINNSKGYSPANCRWATRKDQGRNRRSNRLLTWRGETLPCVVWAERLGLNPATLAVRLHSGWSTARALSTPPKKT